MLYGLRGLALLLLPVMVGAETLTIPRIAEAPQIDDFLKGPIESSMTRVSGFTQRWPIDGDPASQKTIVYLGYDAERLHVVFLAYDDPSLVRATLAPRERIRSDDSVGIMIDAFNDKRRAYSFSTNPLGVQRDQFYVEGQSFDSSYDTVWSSDGKLTDWGYVVHIAVPFKNLRFRPQERQTWGIVLSRGIERSREFNTWPHIASSVAGYLNQAATADGIANVSPGGNMLIIPYTTASSISGIEDDGEPTFINDNIEAKAGVDIKRVWNDAFVTDLTINPDFSQVESDEPQVTVNQRFEVFFEERRPFFLENADVFRTPYNLLFTRRIVDPEAGLRVTGKTGPWVLGSFIIDDEAPGRRLAHSDPDHGKSALFATARVKRDIGEQSSIGAIAVRREFGDTSNLVSGIDGRIKWNELWTSGFQGVHSESQYAEREDTDGDAFYVDLNRQGRHFDVYSYAQFIDEDLEAHAGFVRRTGIKETGYQFKWSQWPENETVVSWGIETDAYGVWAEDGGRLDKWASTGLEIEFPRQTEIELAIGYGREKLTTDEFASLVTDRDYQTNWVSAEFETAWWKTLSFELETSIGDAINFRPLAGMAPRPADWTETSLEVSYRPTTRVTIETSATFTSLDDEASGRKVFDDFISQMRLNWQFTRQLSLRAIVQHERTKPNDVETTISDRKNWNYDLLFTYRVNPWTALYLGYNTNRQNVAIEDFGNMRRIVRTDDLIEDSEQILFKVSYLISG